MKQSTFATKKYKETIASVIALAVGAFLLGRAMRNKDDTDSMSGTDDDKFLKSYQNAGSAANAINKLFRKKSKVYVYYHLKGKKYTVSSIPLKETDWVFEEIERFESEVRDDYEVNGSHVDYWRQRLEMKLYP